MIVGSVQALTKDADLVFAAAQQDMGHAGIEDVLKTSTMRITMNVQNLLKHTPHLMDLSSKTKFDGMEDVLGGKSAQSWALDQLCLQASTAGKHDLWRWFSEWTCPCVKVHIWHLVLERVMQPDRKACKDGFGYSSD